MSATIDLKVTGVRGGQPQITFNRGRVVVFTDSDTYIAIDAFDGQGDSYKRREIALVQVVVPDDGKTTYSFNGIERLAKILKKGFLVDEAIRTLKTLQIGIEFVKKENNADYIIAKQDRELINSTLKKLEQ